jgi:hypothetical protein
MTSDPTRFIGDIPRHYDSGLGPVIFDACAEETAPRAAIWGPCNSSL